MKILLFAYDLVVAGVTVNAIELAAALRDQHGHDVVLYAATGPMHSLAEQHGLRHIEAPPAYLTMHPSPKRLRALRAVVRQERPDVIYAWDWAQCVDTLFVEHLLMKVPMVVTDMCNTLQRLLPRSIPTTFGTPELCDRALAKGHRQACPLLPPVDVQQNAPGAVDPEPFRQRYGLGRNHLNIVTVSRLDSHMKGESLLRTIDAMRTLGRDAPVRFVIVGDGDARSDLERLAQRTNTELGRQAIVFTGALLDPRAAYAAADIVVGMGSSVLRGMAFGKPVVIVGEGGFSAPLTPQTAASFLYNGLYGIGNRDPSNDGLVADLRTVIEQRAELGHFSLNFVREHFSLDTVSAQLSAFLMQAVANQPRRHVALLDSARTAAVWVRERRFIPFGWSARRWLRLDRKSATA
jgi:L-malate glycosyltransferase